MSVETPDYGLPEPISLDQTTQQFINFFDGLVLDDASEIRCATRELDSLDTPGMATFIQAAYKVANKYEAGEQIDEKIKLPHLYRKTTLRIEAARTALRAWVYSGADIHPDICKMNAQLLCKSNWWLKKAVRPAHELLSNDLSLVDHDEQLLHKAYGRAAMDSLGFRSPWPAYDSIVEFLS
jgi:hypothetical protein